MPDPTDELEDQEDTEDEDAEDELDDEDEDDADPDDEDEDGDEDEEEDADAKGARSLEDIWNAYWAAGGGEKGTAALTGPELVQLQAYARSRIDADDEANKQAETIEKALPTTAASLTTAAVELIEEFLPEETKLSAQQKRLVKTLVDGHLLNDTEDGPSLKNILNESVLLPVTRQQSADLQSAGISTKGVDPKNFVRLALRNAQVTPETVPADVKRTIERAAVRRYDAKLNKDGIKTPRGGSGPGPGKGRKAAATASKEALGDDIEKWAEQWDKDPAGTIKL